MFKLCPTVPSMHADWLDLSENPLGIPREPENTQQLQARHILSGYISVVYLYSSEVEVFNYVEVFARD